MKKQYYLLFLVVVSLFSVGCNQSAEKETMLLSSDSVVLVADQEPFLKTNTMKRINHHVTVGIGEKNDTTVTVEKFIYVFDVNGNAYIQKKFFGTANEIAFLKADLPEGKQMVVCAKDIKTEEGIFPHYEWSFVSPKDVVRDKE